MLPHHPGDKAHPLDWNAYDPAFAPLVEIFQVDALDGQAHQRGDPILVTGSGGQLHRAGQPPDGAHPGQVGGQAVYGMSPPGSTIDVVLRRAAAKLATAVLDRGDPEVAETGIDDDPHPGDLEIGIVAVGRLDQ